MSAIPPNVFSDVSNILNSPGIKNIIQSQNFQAAWCVDIFPDFFSMIDFIKGKENILNILNPIEYGSKWYLIYMVKK